MDSAAAPDQVTIRLIESYVTTFYGATIHSITAVYDPFANAPQPPHTNRAQRRSKKRHESSNAHHQRG